MTDWNAGDPPGTKRRKHGARARDLGLDATLFLEKDDSTRFFAALDALIVTGPTHTNVNDFRAILIDPEAGGRRSACS